MTQIAQIMTPEESSKNLHLQSLKKWIRYNDVVKKILIDEWDPIGVNQHPEAQDEYDSYAPGLSKYLLNDPQWIEIFNYLWEIETERMGLQGHRQHTEEIAKRLLMIASELSN
ncbi:MAG: hypothetical protein ABI579_02660 [Candidatus Sumerlaeota bacterium]